MFIKLKRLKALYLCLCLVSVSTAILYYLTYASNEHKAGEDRDLLREKMKDRRYIVRKIAHKGSNTQTCVHPDLDPFNPLITQFWKTYPPVDCSRAEEDWVYTDNGTFRISQRARRLHGHITCEYIPLERLDDFSVSEGLHVTPMVDGAPLKTDFFKVDCVSSSGERYINIHSGVAMNKEVFSRLEEMAANRVRFWSSSQNVDSLPFSNPASTNTLQNNSVPSEVHIGLNLSVFIFAFDSMSRLSWVRLLPRSRWYFLETLGGVELKGYNVVGDGTPDALLPILTGYYEEELPEGRRGMPNAIPVDGYPWVWKEFKRSGYVTAYAEDMAHVGTFQMRLLGFKEQPTDHNMRIFYLAAEKMYEKNAPYCLGSKPRHRNFMHWVEELFGIYNRHPKFFFAFHSEMSHGNNNPVQAVDEDLMLFLDRLEQSGHLNSTLLILMGDHGARYSDIRDTAQGKLEQRMPYLAFRLPPWVKKVYPQLIRNLEINSKRLTTPFDIHETLIDVLTYRGSGVGDISNRGISLFKEIPQNRSCSHAGVTPHWCACLKWDTLNISDITVKSAVKSAISKINSYIASHRKTCALLRLKEITFAARYLPTDEDYMAEQKLRKYMETFRQPSNRGYLDVNQEVYQVSFITKPGNGHFEVTCTLDTTTGKFFVPNTDISRINMYGKDADCIAKSYPHLRPYCYCRAGGWWFW